MKWVYILKCKDGYYYVGETTRLYRRFWEHFSGLGAINTTVYKPEKVVAIYKSNQCVGNCGRNDREGYDKMRYRNKDIDLCRNCFVNYHEKLENIYNIKQASMFIDE
jgi:predicted GIY-YIG superfamily endonuclease